MKQIHEILFRTLFKSRKNTAHTRNRRLGVENGDFITLQDERAFQLNCFKSLDC